MRRLRMFAVVALALAVSVASRADDSKLVVTDDGYATAGGARNREKASHHRTRRIPNPLRFD